MRHYDTQLFDALKFGFTLYTGTIVIAIGAYQFSIRDGKDLIQVALAALTIGLIGGVLIFALIVRNRVYFVQVERYINEQRRHFFRVKPGGFANKAGVYTQSDRGFLSPVALKLLAKF